MKTDQSWRKFEHVYSSSETYSIASKFPTVYTRIVVEDKSFKIFKEIYPMFFSFLTPFSIVYNNIDFSETVSNLRNVIGSLQKSCIVTETMI